MTKIGLYGERHPGATYRGSGSSCAPVRRPGFRAASAGADSPVRAVYLDHFLPDWLERDPQNPYLAVLAPLVIDDDAQIKARAPALWQRVQDTPLAVAEHDTLAQVMLFWFLERFRELTAREVWSMLNLLTPIEETRGYQSIKAEGKAEDKTEAKAEDLTRLLTRRFGSLPAWATVRIAKAPITQIDAWLDGIFDARTLTDLLGPETESPAH